MPEVPQLFVPPQIYTRRIRLQSGKSTPPTRSGRGWPAWFISRNAYAVPTTCDRPIAVTNCVFAIAITLAHHGWLTPAALGARCSFAAKALFAMDKRTFTGAAGVSPPWLDEPDAVPRESNIVQRLASTRSGAAGVSPPWLGERDAVPRESNIVQRLASTRSGAVGVSPPWLAEMHLHGRYRKHAKNCYRWVGRRRCHRGRSVRGSTRTMRSNTAKRHCRPGRLPSHGGLTPPLLVVRAFVHRKSRHFTGTRSVRTKSGDRTPAAMLPRITYSALRAADISRASEMRIPCKETRVPLRNLGGCWPWFAAPRRQGWRGINRLGSSWA